MSNVQLQWHLITLINAYAKLFYGLETEFAAVSLMTLTRGVMNWYFRNALGSALHRTHMEPLRGTV
jgi:hypothetical protein